MDDSATKRETDAGSVNPHYKKPITKQLRYLYGIADFGFSGYTGVMTNFWNFFLTDIMRITPALVGMITTVQSLINTYTTPFYGLIMQKVKALKWGKVRSWLIIIPPITLVFFTLCYSGIGIGTAWAAYFVLVVRSITPIAWNITWTANAAMLEVLSQTADDRVKLARNKQVYSFLGTTLWAVAMVPVATFIGNAVGVEVRGYTITACFIALIAVVCYYTLFKATKGYDTTTEEEVAAKNRPKEKVRLIDTLKALYKNPPLLVTLLVGLGWHCVNYVMVGLVVYYFRYVAENIALMSLNNLIATGASVVGAYFGGVIAPKIGIRNTSIVTSLIMAVALSIAGFTAVNSAFAFIICFTVMKIAYGAATVQLNAMFANCALYGEYVSGENQALFVMGLQQTPLVLSSLFRGLVTNAILAYSGYVVGEAASEAMKVAITNALCIGPALFAVLALVCVLFYRLTDAKVNELTEKIAARKAGGGN